VAGLRVAEEGILVKEQGPWEALDKPMLRRLPSDFSAALGDKIFRERREKGEAGPGRVRHLLAGGAAIYDQPGDCKTWSLSWVMG
jgi:hypothetical protein